MMKKSYKFILIATALVVMGFTMDVIFDYVPFSTNPQVTDVSIEPNSDYLFQINSKGEVKMSGLFSSTPKESPISLKIISPDRSIIWEGKSVTIPYDSSADHQSLSPVFFNSNSKGTLDVIITNLGDRPVIVDGGIFDVVEYDPNVTDFNAAMSVFSEIILYTIFSILLKIVGIIIGIISMIFVFKDRKKTH